MYYDPYFEKETLYIAGPECFYQHGYQQWFAMRKMAEMLGFRVVMPSNNKLSLNHKDLRKNADEIFKNCASCINESTILICDLEFFRGANVDGGSIYEVGMAYARGCRCYGFTRDLRAMKYKYQESKLEKGVLYDINGCLLSYQELPFSPNVFSSMKIVEGDFSSALDQVVLDLIEDRKVHKRNIEKAISREKIRENTRPKVLLSGPERFDIDARKKYKEMKKICQQYGLDVTTPMESTRFKEKDPYTEAYHTLLHNKKNVIECDAIIANPELFMTVLIPVLPSAVLILNDQ